MDMTAEPSVTITFLFYILEVLKFANNLPTASYITSVQLSNSKTKLQLVGFH